MNDHKAMSAYIQGDLWALEPSVLDRAVQIFTRHFNGVKLDEDALAEIAQSSKAGRADAEFETIRGTAVIPITGVIAKGAGMVNQVSQPKGTATQTITANLNAALADDEVERIMLLVDSPGGSVAGVADLAAAIRAASTKKPLTAFIEDTGASAGYWLASQAGQVFANKTAAVGSIGVFAVVLDSSQAAEKAGLKFHVIKSGEHKGAGATGTEITDEHLGAFQERIDDVFDLFVADVAGGRNMAEKKVLAVADGRAFTGKKAKKAGLVDAITDFDGALKRTARATVADRPRRARAEIEEPIMADEKDTAAEVAAALAAQEQTHEADKAEAAKAAVEADRTRSEGIMDAVGGFPEIAKAAVSGGLSIDQAKANAYDAAMEQCDDLQGKLTAIAESGTAAAPGGRDTETEVAKTAEQAADEGDDDGTAETYQAALTALQDPKRSKGPLTASHAHKVAAEKFPKSHVAWNASKVVAPADRK